MDLLETEGCINTQFIKRIPIINPINTNNKSIVSLYQIFMYLSMNLTSINRGE